jgi:DNA invertase Pin-like site-specific DNA recombinase
MRAAIYVRISEDDGEGLGVKRQEQDGRAEAARRGWEVVGVYPDNDVSATRSKTRPFYERMLRDIRAGLVQAVIVWDIDRLTRTPREVEDFIELADATGLVLVNLTGMGEVETDDGRMMLRIKGALARREIEQMRKRLKRKYLENATQGKPHGRTPYGMRRVDGRDVPDPATAPILHELARRVLDRESLRSIATDLTRRGVRSPGDEQRIRALVKAGTAEVEASAQVDATPAAWNSTVIRQLLVRPAYAGIRIHQGKAVGAANGEPVFDVDTHNRLVALLTDPTRRENYRGRQPLYLLSGIARCGRCGGTMRSQVGRITTTAKGSKRQPPSYGCSFCFRVRRQRERVDALVEIAALTVLEEMRDDPRLVARLFVRGNPKAAQEAMEKIAAIDAKLARNVDMLDADQMTNEQFARSNARLREDRATAEGRLRSAAPNDALEKFAGPDVGAVWEAATIGERREVVDTLFDVVIHPQGPGRAFDIDAIKVTRKRQIAEDIDATPVIA